MDKLTTKQEREIRRQEKLERDAAAQKKQQITNILIWVGIAVVLLGSVFVIYKASGNTPKGPGSQPELVAAQNLAPVTDKDMQRGPKDAKVTLIEYADFQCPACKYYHPIVNQLYGTYKNRVRFVYRFFPLTSLHQHAMQSAEAAYAASLQGKFWEMGDLLFDNQDTWATAANFQDTFNGYAKQLGLDVTKFEADMQDKNTAEVINASEDTGIKTGVNGTPTFFIDGKQIMTSPQDYNAFKKLINQELQKQSK